MAPVSGGGMAATWMTNISGQRRWIRRQRSALATSGGSAFSRTTAGWWRAASARAERPVLVSRMLSPADRSVSALARDPALSAPTFKTRGDAAALAMTVRSPPPMQGPVRLMNPVPPHVAVAAVSTGRGCGERSVVRDLRLFRGDGHGPAERVSREAGSGRYGYTSSGHRVQPTGVRAGEAGWRHRPSSSERPIGVVPGKAGRRRTRLDRSSGAVQPQRRPGKIAVRNHGGRTRPGDRE